MEHDHETDVHHGRHRDHGVDRAGPLPVGAEHEPQLGERVSQLRNLLNQHGDPLLEPERQEAEHDPHDHRDADESRTDEDDLFEVRVAADVRILGEPERAAERGREPDQTEEPDQAP
ncbi:MAG: hypothetical protein U0791_15165 [Gemmataceae bacterium]